MKGNPARIALPAPRFRICTLYLCLWLLAQCGIRAAQSGDFLYTVTNASATITGYKGTNTVVVVPDTIETLPVAGIGISAFIDNSNIKNVELPGSLQTIGDSAFSTCIQLTNITLPASLVVIGQKAFYNCRNLRQAVLPDSLMTLGDDAFYWCSYLTNVSFGNGLTNLGKRAFAYSRLRQATLPDSLGTLGDYAFIFCTELTNVTFGNGLTNLGRQAFAYSNLRQAILPDSLVTLGDSAFSPGTSLTNVIFGNGLTNLGSRAFERCSGLRQIVLPESLTAVGSYAFNNCSGLTNLIFRGGLTTIGPYAFAQCTKLTTIHLPESVLVLGESAFQYCSGLTNLTLPNSLEKIGDFAFEGCSKMASIILPNTSPQLGSYVFSGCSSLTSVYFKGNCPSWIGSSIFSGDKNITVYYLPGTTGWTSTFWGGYPTAVWTNHPTFIYSQRTPSTISITDYIGDEASLDIPKEIEGMAAVDIGAYAFANHATLAAITTPDSLTNIGANAFYKCAQLSSLALGSNVAHIGDNALSMCAKLASITVAASNPSFSSVDGVLFNRDQTVLIQYPAGRVGSYAVPEGVTRIGDSAFYGCVGLSNITLPNSLVAIGSKAFQGCTGLGEIQIPDQVTSIGAAGFKLCTSLAKVNLGSSVMSIGDGAFNTCLALHEVYFEGNLPAAAGSGLFASTPCNLVHVLGGTSGWGAEFGGLPTVFWSHAAPFAYHVLPPSTVSLYEYLGSDTQVEVPETIDGYAVVSLENNTFSKAVSVATLSLPASLTNIDGQALGVCATLASFTVNSNNPAYCDYAGTLFSKDRATIIQCPPATTGSYTIPDSVTQIASTAFYGCAQLTNLCLPDSISQVDGRWFSQCHSLASFAVNASSPAYSTTDGVLFNKDQTVLVCFPWAKGESYTVPNRVTNIAAGAFYACTGLTNVVLPHSLASIGDQAFYGCASLKTLYFAGNAPVLGESVFIGDYVAVIYYAYGTSGWQSTSDFIGASPWPDHPPYIYEELSSSAIVITQFYGSGGDVAVPSTLDGWTVVGIAENAFAGSAYLNTLSLPDTITNLGSYAFSGCTSLAKVTLGTNLLQLGDYAFNGCAALASISLPASVTQIGDGAFYGCAHLADLAVDPANASYCTAAGVLFDRAQTCLILCPSGKTGNYVAPASVTVIASDAFNGCASLGGITLPNSVTHVGDWAFFGCSCLTNLILGDGLLSLGTGAFSGCASLASLILPKGVTALKGWTFSGCASLSGLYFAGNAPTLSSDNAFQNAYQTTVYYQAGTTGWEAYYGGRPTAFWAPTYGQWTVLTGLASEFPAARGETDDPDRDGMSNLAEMRAGTDPLDVASRLALELTARPEDLSSEDQTPLATRQFVIYFQSAPGKSYDVLACGTLGSPWAILTNLAASATQTRIVLPLPSGSAFYRVQLH